MIFLKSFRIPTDDEEEFFFIPPPVNPDYKTKKLPHGVSDEISVSVFPRKRRPGA